MNKVKPNGRRFMRRVTVGFETRRRRRRRKRIISPQSSRTYFNKSEGRGGERESWVVEMTVKEFILNSIPRGYNRRPSPVARALHRRK